MTAEERYCLTIDEILSFHFKCNDCHVESVYPVGNIKNAKDQCPHCGHRWLEATPEVMGTIGIALDNFVKSIEVIAKESRHLKCEFSVEIRGERPGQ
jgi:DNA-directed RNA polymerase subunit RPC12/RpoP